MPIDLAEVMRNEEIRDALFSLCDVYLEQDTGEPLWCTIDGATKVTTIARDGSGGRFVTVPPLPRVFFVSSEGAAGCVAADIDEFITLCVTCPFWSQLLHFSGGGSLEEMRRALPVLEEYWLEEEDDAGARREWLMSELGIAPPDDLVGAMHRSVTTEVVFAHVEDGSDQEPLIGKYTIDDNPMFKPYI